MSQLGYLLSIYCVCCSLFSIQLGSALTGLSTDWTQYSVDLALPGRRTLFQQHPLIFPEGEPVTSTIPTSEMRKGGNLRDQTNVRQPSI